MNSSGWLALSRPCCVSPEDRFDATHSASRVLAPLHDAAILIEPVDIDGLAKAIIGILENEEGCLNLISAGIKQAAKFSWEKAAKQTYEIYQKVVTA